MGIIFSKPLNELGNVLDLISQKKNDSDCRYLDID